MNTTSNNTHIDELISGYLTQKLQKEELQELHAWLLASNENKTHFMQMQEVWFSAVSANHKMRFDSEKAFERFLINTKENNSPPINKSTSTPNTKYLFLNTFKQIAAVAAILLVVGTLAFWLGRQQISSQFAQISVEAPLGSRTKLNLPDGTLLWLNAGSHISYSQGFGVKDRHIELVGEGYFEVTKNKKLPLFVHTKEMTVRVLGTKFNFRNYDNEDELRVSLLEGKVAFNKTNEMDKAYLLLPNQKVVLDKKTGKALIQQVDAKRSADWTNGLLSFDEEKLTDISKELERAYNVRIKIADEQLLGFRFYGNFTRTEQTITEVLDVLASTNKLRYIIIGKEITLHKK
ncbi:MAG: hypothetical protein AUK44_03945 [Porphyromonadaceae bacterium CG2_30_38_12]|nr:MAG: hypothetical protein AUK44_03945 [Porphyromonadaceae bacterium CG2_30_38_12]